MENYKDIAFDSLVDVAKRGDYDQRIKAAGEILTFIYRDEENIRWEQEQKHIEAGKIG